VGTQIAETSRLILREMVPADAGFLFELNQDPDVLRFTGDEPFASVSEAEAFLSGYTGYQDYGMGRWLVILKETCDLLGWCGLKFHPETGMVDLGFRFLKKHWGAGYATEAAKSCLEYGFGTLGLFQITGRALSGNPASSRVLEKSGMTRKGQSLDDHGLWETWEIIKPF